jgi:renalase
MQGTVAVVGAGLAGLAAAGRLVEAGRKVVLFEKSLGVGGRVATRRVEGCILDHVAQVIKPDGFPLADTMLHQLPTADLVEVLAPVRVVTSNGEILPADPHRSSQHTYTYRYGLTTLPKLLIAALPTERFAMRLETRIGMIEEGDDGFLLRDDRGTELLRADCVVLTAPAPQAADLLESCRLRDTIRNRTRIDALRSVSYHSCLTVLLGYAAPAPLAPTYALLSADRTRPLLWLAFEQTKDPSRAPRGEAALIAQLGPAISQELYGAPDTEILALTLRELHALFGAAYAHPVWHQVKRWRYSHPNGMVDFMAVNSAPAADSRLVVCGDALRPENGRVYQAYSSGLEAAEFLLQSA